LHVSSLLRANSFQLSRFRYWLSAAGCLEALYHLSEFPFSDSPLGISVLDSRSPMPLLARWASPRDFISSLSLHSTPQRVYICPGSNRPGAKSLDSKIADAQLEPGVLYKATSTSSFSLHHFPLTTDLSGQFGQSPSPQLAGFNSLSSNRSFPRQVSVLSSIGLLVRSISPISPEDLFSRFLVCFPIHLDLLFSRQALLPHTIRPQSRTPHNFPGSNEPCSNWPGANIPGSQISGSKIAGSKIPGSKIPGSKIPDSKIPG
jgi:hypothetical protein